MSNDSIIRNVIYHIFKLHVKFSKKLSVDHNLRKYDVRDSWNDYTFMYEIIPDYLARLKNNQKLSYTLNYYCLSWDFQPRIKSLDTTYEKLEHYIRKEDKSGGMYASKTLNDLLGTRIILDHLFKDKNKINCLLKHLKDENIISRYYTRNDHGYHAIHCYFQLNNKCFPWELQIWDSNDKSSNYGSHKRHEK